MPRLLIIGLIASGSGVALFFIAIAVGVGSCAGTTLGTFTLLVAVCLVPTGILLCIAAGVAAILKRKSKPIA
jgi:putative effector of murein hydrolase LrgA (UPF0299 family)